nr:MAG TPA: hypothetical protein [Caudoviricetes sp.]
MREKQSARSLRKSVCQCYALKSPAAHRLAVSCRTGKGAGRAKETPLRNWSTKGFATMQNSIYLLSEHCKYNALFLWSKLCGTFLSEAY